MSHSSGIPVSASLESAFRALVTGSDGRLLKIQIENDELLDRGTISIGGTWQDDLALAQPLFETDKPCYVVFRKEKDASVSEWLLFCYVPDKAKVKDKMLYASTRAPLKQQLGSSYFADDVFGTLPADFSLKGYTLHVASREMEAPLTESELQKKEEVERGEIHISVGASSYVHGVAFPVDAAVSDAVNSLASGRISYVQVAIDMANERIILDHTDSITFDGLRDKIHQSQPRFHFFAYTHEHQGEELTSNVYVYSCPDGSNGSQSAPVRQRMLYSSSKANVANLVPNIGAKVEINTGHDLNEETILLQLHPKVEEKAAGFAKPARPGKGARRLIK
eukprot:TRINITY_DN9062_c0_g1_i1.p1 TRINITY_DN9062_c0_g1~~TRINITY_DN9062_c0_g1_i1.p1  ORF type:complete len:336 (-),score=64.65 TRINITY_DN9062_c0_g1_i1:45-1052(-)